MTIRSPSPNPTYRLIPSRFPPIGLFDTVANVADMEAAMELAGWTNDRLVAERVRLLPRQSWPMKTPNASIVMAAFLHAPVNGMRFSSSLLGAWYAADDVLTSIAEVGHHLRREAFSIGRPSLSRQYRTYVAELDGLYVDIRGLQAERPELFDSGSYAASQIFGEEVRAAGEAGLLYPSARRRGFTSIAAFIPSNIRNVVQAEHYRLTVHAGSNRIEIERLGQS